MAASAGPRIRRDHRPPASLWLVRCSRQPVRLQVNGLTDIVLTKLDVLTGLKEIPICVAYDVDGERHDDMPTDQAAFAAAKPIYETMPGWDEDISNCHSFDELPATCQAYVKRLEELSGCRISAIGTGPQRDHIISVHSLID